MNETSLNQEQVRAGLQELEQRLIALGNTVESLFADSVMALIERIPEAAPELREEDYKAHERWREIEKLCIDLLSSGALEREQVQFVAAAGKIATDLKRTADESLRIAEHIRPAGRSEVRSSAQLGPIPQMAELTQSMLSDALEAFINRDGPEASGLHLIFRQLAELGAEAVESLAQAMQKRKLPVATGLAYAGMAERLEGIGKEVLNISSQVSHLCRNNA